MLCIDYRILLVVWVFLKSSKSLLTDGIKIYLFAYAKTPQRFS